LRNEQFLNSKNVAIYLSTETEVDTIPIITEIFKRGKTCYIPKIEKGALNFYKLNSLEEIDSFPLSIYGIKEPNDTSNRENPIAACKALDVVITPGVAFGEKGERLGHGKGFYDKFFTKYSQLFPKSPTYKIGICFDDQIIINLPNDINTDIRMDCCIVGTLIETDNKS